MYVNKIPFTRDTKKGPQSVLKGKKTASTPKPEPAKIEVEAESVDLIIEPQAEEITEEPTDGDN